MVDAVRLSTRLTFRIIRRPRDWLGHVSVKNGALQSDFDYVDSQPPRDRPFKRALEAKLDRVRVFLGLES